MGILGYILVKYYRRRDLPSQGMKGELWRALVEGAKTPTIFALGFFTNAALTLNSDEAKQRMARVESLKESMAESKSYVESTIASVKSMEERQEKIEKGMDDLVRRQQQRIEKSREKLSGVSLNEMDQKKRAEFVLRMKLEYGIFKN